jgi:hypothetical protein
MQFNVFPAFLNSLPIICFFLINYNLKFFINTVICALLGWREAERGGDDRA